MAYDNIQYNIWPNVYATFAGGLLGTTATNTNSQTSAGVVDRVEFFRAVKLTGFNVLPEVAPDCGAHATSQTVYAELCRATTVLARATLGTVAGVMADGTIVSASVAAGTALNVRCSVTTWDGTVQTMAPGGWRCQIEYQERI